MAKITKPIQQRYFEIIRDRIAEILADELNNQAVLNNDPNLDATIFTERLIPIDVSDMPCVTIGVAESEFDNFRQLTKDGNYDYQIDVFEKAPSTDLIDGDYASSVKLQRLVGVIDAILSNPIYRTLGFKAPSISRVEVQGFQMATPTEEQRSKNITMCRMRVHVRVNESVDGVDGVLLAGYQTTVRLGLTNQGYVFSGTAPITPYEPACAGVRVYNSSESFDINVASGDSALLPDITVTDSDGTTRSVPAMTDVVCSPALDATVNITNSDNDLLGSVVVPSGGVGTFVVSELPIKTDFIIAAYNENDLFTTANVTVSGNVNDVIIEGLTNVTMKKNGTVITNLTNVTAGDAITFEFDSAVSEGVILIEGYYA